MTVEFFETYAEIVTRKTKVFENLPAHIKEEMWDKIRVAKVKIIDPQKFEEIGGTRYHPKKRDWTTMRWDNQTPNFEEGENGYIFGWDDIDSETDGIVEIGEEL